MSILASCNYFLDTRHQLKDFTYPVKLTVYFMGKKKRYKTQFACKKSDYEKLINNLSKSEALRQLKKQMDHWLMEQRIIIESISPFSFDEYEKLLHKEIIDAALERDAVETLFNEYIERLKKRKSIGTATSYQTALNSLLSYKKNLRLSEIDEDFLNDYETALLAKKKSETTIGIYLRSLRAVFNFAIDKEVVHPKKYPFKKYTIPAPRSTKKALKKNDVKKIFSYETEDTAREKALDFWKFSFLCNGMNFKDIALLKNEDFKGDFIEFRRSKTRRTTKSGNMPIRIPMNDMSKAILRKYRGKGLNPKDPIFPIITKSMDEVQIDKAVENFIQITNKWLKRIGTELELPLKFTTYVARHSFATIQKNNGLSREYLKESLGHSSIATTERYLSSFEDEDVVEMHRKLLEGIV